MAKQKVVHLDENTWCRGWESNPHRPEARGILRLREEGSAQKTLQFVALFPCPRSPRRVVESEDYGHPDGYRFQAPWTRVSSSRCWRGRSQEMLHQRSGRRRASTARRLPNV